MVDADTAAHELVARGKQLYQNKLKALLEPSLNGQFAALEPDTEQYFVAADAVDALLAGRAKMPDKLFFLVRIGYPTAHKMGGYAKRNG